MIAAFSLLSLLTTGATAAIIPYSKVNAHLFTSYFDLGEEAAHTFGLNYAKESNQPNCEALLTKSIADIKRNEPEWTPEVLAVFRDLLLMREVSYGEFIGLFAEYKMSDAHRLFEKDALLWLPNKAKTHVDRVIIDTGGRMRGFIFDGFDHFSDYFDWDAARSTGTYADHHMDSLRIVFEVRFSNILRRELTRAMKHLDALAGSGHLKFLDFTSKGSGCGSGDQAVEWLAQSVALHSSIEHLSLNKFYFEEADLSALFSKFKKLKTVSLRNAILRDENEWEEVIRANPHIKFLR